MREKKSKEIMLLIAILGLLAGCNNKNEENNHQKASIVIEENVTHVESVITTPIIKSIKEAKFSDFSKTLTVGQAFDGWKACKNTQWKEQDDSSINFICELNDPSNYMITGKSDQDAIENIRKIDIVYIFSVSADKKKIEPSYSKEIFTFKDGKQYIYEDSIPEYMLHFIFNNDTSFGLSVTQEDYLSRH